MTKTDNDPLAVIGGALVLVAIICPFFAVWVESYRLEFMLTAVWAAMLVLIIGISLKRVKKDKRAHDALNFVEHIEHHLRTWEKVRKLKKNSLKVMCKICNMNFEDIVKKEKRGEH